MPEEAISKTTLCVLYLTIFDNKSVSVALGGYPRNVTQKSQSLFSRGSSESPMTTKSTGSVQLKSTVSSRGFKEKEEMVYEADVLAFQRDCLIDMTKPIRDSDANQHPRCLL